MLRMWACAVLGVVLASGSAEAAEGCKVKVDKKTGEIGVSAKNVGTNLLWGEDPGDETRTFANEAECIVGTKAKNCLLGASGTRDNITPPPLCTLYLADDTAACSAHVPGCTPGVRYPGSTVEFADEAGANSAGGDQPPVPLGPTATVVRSVTVDAPAPGLVIVNGSGYFDFGSTSSEARCAITTATSLGTDLMRQDGDGLQTFAGTRGFVVGMGPTTFNLVCDELAGDASVVDSHLTAIFAPTVY